MLILPMLIEIVSVTFTYCWLFLFMNLKFFIFFFLLACILVVLYKHTFYHGLYASALIVILTVYPIYTHLIPPVIHCAHYKDSAQIAFQSKILRNLHCSKPLNYTTFQELRLDLPYIGGESYLIELYKHVCTLPVERTLVIWGPKSIGKTEGLLRASLAWNRQGRIVMFLNMKGFTGSYYDFVIMFRQLILDYIGTYPFSFMDIHILQNCLSSSHPSSNFIIWQEHWRDYVSLLFNNPEKITQVDFPGLLRLLDLIALLHPKTGPILILSEVQDLDKLGEQGKALLSTIIETLEGRMQTQGLVPVVIETSNTMWAADYHFAPSVRRSREAFKGYLVRTSFGREDGHKTLVVDNKLLTEEQYSTLWNALGGHAGSWNIVYSRLSPYETVESIITTELNEVRKLLRGIIRDFSGDKKLIENEFIELRKQNFVAKLEDNIAVKYLVDMNVLFREDDDVVTAQYQLIQTAICNYLDELAVIVM